MAVVERYGPEHLDDLVVLGQQIIALTAADRDMYLGGLDADQLATAEAAIAAAEQEDGDWRRDPAFMSHRLSRGRWKLWPYWRLLGEKFRQAVHGESKRQIWNLPSRYGKSWMAGAWGPAWALDYDPTKTILLVSYGDDLAMENADHTREIMREHRDVLRARLRPDRQEKKRFVTTEGGGIRAASIEGGITGYPGDGIVFDDPYKNWQAAHSKANRDNLDNTFRSVLGTRVETKDTWIIIVMTRWHEDDICGRLIQRMLAGEGEHWDVTRIPDIAETPDPTSHRYEMRLPDPLGRQPGEVIEPERFDLEMVRTRHLAAGTYLTASMFQQRPAPEEGSEIKRAWFRDIDRLPSRFDIAISSWDMKLKDKETGDYVVGQYWGRVSSSYYLGDQLRGQWNQATTENAIALMAVRHPDIRTHYIENTGNGPEVMSALRAGHPGYQVSAEIAGILGMTMDERIAVSEMRQRGIGNLLPVNPKGPKPVRMRAVSGYIEAGSVFVLEHAPWRGVYLDEMASFPNGHDDQVDTTSQALSKLIGSQASLSSPADQMLPKTQVRRGSPSPIADMPNMPGPIGPNRQRRAGNIINPANIIYPHKPPTSGR